MECLLERFIHTRVYGCAYFYIRVRVRIYIRVYLYPTYTITIKLNRRTFHEDICPDATRHSCPQAEQTTSYHWRMAYDVDETESDTPT